jgi:hypothetical protein
LFTPRPEGLASICRRGGAARARGQVRRSLCLFPSRPAPRPAGTPRTTPRRVSPPARGHRRRRAHACARPLSRSARAHTARMASTAVCMQPTAVRGRRDVRRARGDAELARAPAGRPVGRGRASASARTTTSRRTRGRDHVRFAQWFIHPADFPRFLCFPSEVR